MKLEHLGRDLDMVTDLLRARCLKFHSYIVNEILVEISDCSIRLRALDSCYRTRCTCTIRQPSFPARTPDFCVGLVILCAVCRGSPVRRG